MRKILVTVFFDVDHNKLLEKRDIDRFIVESTEENFRAKLFDIFEEKKYSWDDFEKMRNGYKGIMGFEHLDLTDIEIFTDKSLELEEKYATSADDEEELENDEDELEF